MIRRLPNVVLAGALAMLALLALPGSGRAQSHTMHFRPVSPESASSYERDARQGERDTSSWNATPSPAAVPPAPGVGSQGEPEEIGRAHV